MTVHVLKTWPVPYVAVSTGQKPYEIRRADRPYSEGDSLVLREFVPPEVPGGEGTYTGRWSVWRVTHMTSGGAWGIPVDLVVMGVRPVNLRTIEQGSPLWEALAPIMTQEQREQVWGPDDECPGCPACTALSSGLLVLNPPPPCRGDGPEDPPAPPGMPSGRFRFN